LSLLTVGLMKFVIVLRFVDAVSLPISLSAIAVTTLKIMSTFEGVSRSKAGLECDIDKTLRSVDRVFVLFYAS
jgi:hypothetical protein